MFEKIPQIDESQESQIPQRNEDEKEINLNDYKDKIQYLNEKIQKLNKLQNGEIIDGQKWNALHFQLLNKYKNELENLQLSITDEERNERIQALNEKIEKLNRLQNGEIIDGKEWVRDEDFALLTKANEELEVLKSGRNNSQEINKERIAELRKKQIDGPWTEDDRQELLRLTSE